VQARAAAMRKPVGALVRVITILALVIWVATVAASAAAVADGGASTTTRIATVAAADSSVQPLWCGILPRNLTQCQVMYCAQRMKPLIPCLDYLRALAFCYLLSRSTTAESCFLHVLLLRFFLPATRVQHLPCAATAHACLLQQHWRLV
jgi:hypothetical protein